MNFFSFVFYDIKRLFGHGRTAVIAIITPVLLLLLFAVFLIPMISTGNGVSVSCALCVEDQSGVLNELVNIVASSEVEQGTAAVYPVDDPETGIRLVEEGKVAAFLYIPDHTYTDSMSGKQVFLDYHYAKEHAFDAILFHSSINSSLSVFGQGIRMVFLAGDVAMKHGLSEEDVVRFWNEGAEDLIVIHSHRGRIIGKNGVFWPGGDYMFRYAMGILFAICAFFVSFPVMYLTGLDVSRYFGKRNIPTSNLFRNYFARLLSGASLILCTFLIMYPIARAIRQIKLGFALSVLPALFLTALMFSALAILFGALLKNGHTALWAGMYFGILSIAGVVFLPSESILPKVVSFLMRISPFRACVSIFSNAMFSSVPERYWMDMLILSVSFLLFVAVGLFVYVKRGSRG